MEINKLSTLSRKYRRRPIRFRILPFNIDVSSPMAERFADHSSRRALCCTVGGSLGFFLVQQPLRVVVSNHNPSKHFVSCTKGNLVSVAVMKGGNDLESDNMSGDGSSTDFSATLSASSQNITDELMYMLCDGIVRGYALRSGILMFQMSVRRIPVNIDKVGDTDHLAKSNVVEESLSYKALKGSLVDLKQGDPCCIYYCKGTGHLAVGYSDGGVSLLTIHPADIEAYKNCDSLDIAPSSNIPIKTCDAHHTPITAFANASLTSPDTKDLVEYLVIGDEYGLLSIWSIKSSHQLKTSGEVNRCYVGHCHKKGISNVEIIYLNHSMSHQSMPTRDPVKNQCVILTTCLSGDIKVWSLSTNLGLITLVGSLHSFKKVLSVGFVVLPFLCSSAEDYNHGNSVQNIDENDCSSVMSASKVTTKPPKCDEEFNIVCAAGHGDGKISSWIFSSNVANARGDASSIIHAHSSPVISIVPLPDARKKESYFQQEVAKLMLSASSDGSSCLFGISKSGYLVPLHLYYAPGPTRSLVVCQGALIRTPKAEVEILQINESNIISFISLTAPFNSSAIPVRWRQDTRPRIVDEFYVPAPDSYHARKESTQSSLSEVSINRESTSSANVTVEGLPLNLCVGNGGSHSTPNVLPNEVHSPLIKSDTAQPKDSPKSQNSSVQDELSDTSKSVCSRMSLKNLKESSARQQWMQNNDIVSVNSEMNDDIDDKPVDNWADTLDIRVELFLAKKDGRLLELFRHKSTRDDVNNIDAIRSRDAVDILDNWISKNIDDDINGQRISRNQILEIFKFLGISPKEMIDFIKVAKIASVIKTLSKGQGVIAPFNQPVIAKKNRLNKKFKAMRSTTTLVTYNAMGERVIQKIPLVDKTLDGIPDGYGDEIREIWALQPPRVMYHINMGKNSANEPNTIMKRIPIHIVRRLYGKIKIPKKWSSSMEHWFDLRRTVRVSRTLFDMRFVAQRDFMVKHKIQKMNHYELPTMTDLVIKYFERSYGKGHGDMNVAHQKVVSFLEALCQYSEHSLVNTLRYFIFSEEEEFEEGLEPTLNNRTIDTYEWLYTESREWVKENCKFLNGGEVVNENQTMDSSLHAGGVYLEAHSVTSLGGGSSTLGAGTVHSMNVQWLLIRRADALLCVQEMLRVRGGYGPVIIENLVYMVDSVLPPVSPVSSVDADIAHEYFQPARDYIDFEQFLEVLAFEMRKHDQEISRVRDKLFSTKCLPDPYIHATASMQSLMRHDKQVSTQDESVDEFVSLFVFQATQDMMQIFIGLDPMRSGFIPKESFSKSLKNFLDNCNDSSLNLNSESLHAAESAFKEEDNKNVLIKECVVRFGDASGLDNVGYIDFVAVVLAFLLSSSARLDKVNSEWMMHAVTTTRKGLDRDKGMILLNYLSLAQGYRQQQDPQWMVHPKVKKSDDDPTGTLSTEVKNGVNTLLEAGVSGKPCPLGIEVKHSGKISYEGNWSLKPVLPAADGPGNLTVKRANVEYSNGAAEIGLVSDGVASRSLLQKSSDSNLYIVPAVMTTSRTLSTLHGEVFVSHKIKQPQLKEKATISQFDVSEEAFQSLPPSSDHTTNTSKSSRFAPMGSQIIEGFRFDNSSSLLHDDTAPPTTANTQLTLTLPSEGNLGNATVVSSPSESQEQEDLQNKATKTGPPSLPPPTDRTPLVTSRSYDSTGQMSLPQEYIDMQNRTFILSEMDDLKANKKLRVDEERRKKREQISQSIEEKRSQKSSGLGDSTISVGSYDYILDKGSQGEETVNDIINLFSNVSEVYPEGYVDHCIDESTRQLYALRDLEEKMYKELGDAAIYQQLQIHEKHLQMKQEKKDQRKKEKDAMILKAKQDEERFRRLEAGRNLERQREAEADAEKRAQEEAERQKKLERRLERQKADQLKKEKALKEAEMQRELQELIAMRKVEKFCIAAEKHFKELEEAERLRKIAEEEAQAAKEAERRRRELEAEQKEAERLRREEERRLREEERKAKEAENELRLREMKAMQKEDWDVGKPHAPLEVEEDEDEGDEEEEDDSEEGSDEEDYDQVLMTGEVNDSKKRLVELIQNLKIARRGNVNHPRRSYNTGSFFQPMLFENDIQFNAFSNQGHMVGEYGSFGVDDDEEDPEKGYEDIVRTIQNVKNQQHKDKMKRLYGVNNDNIPASQWTTLILKDTVDWDDFFDDDYAKAFPGCERKDATPFEKKKRLLRKKEKEQRAKNMVITKTVDNVTMVVGTSTSVVPTSDDDNRSVGRGENDHLYVETETAKIIPLPLGKLFRGNIPRGHDQYFQLEIGDMTSILTVDVRSTESQDIDCLDVDMSTRGYYPSGGNAELRAAKYHDSNRHVIVYNPAERLSEKEFVEISSRDERITTTLVVGVHHKHSSKVDNIPYEIWALTTKGAPESEAIENVSKTVKVLDIISSASEEELWKNMPRVHRDAHKKVGVTEKKRQSPQVLSPAQLSENRKKMDSKVDEEELMSFESFITKSGRDKFRQNLSSLITSTDSIFSDSQYSRVDQPVDPNMHEGLFAPPQLNSLDDVLEQSSQEYFPPLIARRERTEEMNCDDDDRALREAENMIQRSESLPQLDNRPSLATDSFFNNQSSSTLLEHQRVTLAKFPYISKTQIRRQDLNPKPKPRKMREYPDPKPIKYTTSKF